MLKIAFAIIANKAAGQRYCCVGLRNINIDSQREVTEDEVELVITLMENLSQNKITDCFWKIQNDMKDGNYMQVLAHGLENKLYKHLKQLKKIQVPS